MLKTLTLIIFLAFTSSAWSQRVDEGRLQYVYGQYLRSADIFHQLLKTDPGHAEAWFMLIRNYLMQEQRQQASDSLAKAGPELQQQPYFKLAKAALLLEEKQPGMAKQLFQEMLDQTKNKNTDLMADIAEINIESANGDYQYAIDLLEKAIRKDKKNARLYNGIGKAYRKLHNGTEAYKAFTAAIEKDRDQPVAYHELGRLFLSQKNTELYLEYFNKAIQADPRFLPAYYALYTHYLYIDPATARNFFLAYRGQAAPSISLDYDYTDILYLTRNYDSAIVYASNIIATEGERLQPRLFKLIAYSYQETADTIQAIDYMKRYFQSEADSNFVLKDFETMAGLYMAVPGNEDSAGFYYQQALAKAEDPALKKNYLQRLTAMAKKNNDYSAEAYWLGQTYSTDPQATNVTLFNWGLAAYRAEDYPQADSVFGLYTAKYTDQGYGYYWRARANAAIDTSMEQGLAIPHYQKLIEVVDKDTLSTSDKKWITEAYGYLASYEANTEKDYPEAIEYLRKLLELEPTNEQVQKNIEILEKTIAVSEKSSTD